MMEPQKFLKTSSLILLSLTISGCALFKSPKPIETIVTKTVIQKQNVPIMNRPKPVVLNDVILTNKRLSSIEIIQEVYKNIDKNYEKGLTKNKIFLSKRSSSKTKRFNTSKFKSSIKEINRSLLDSISNNLSKENKNALETLCYQFGSIEEDMQKISLIKARETYNKEDEILESLNTKLELYLKKNIKSDSYFKIKSGFFNRILANSMRILHPPENSEVGRLKSSLSNPNPFNTFSTSAS